MAQDNLANKQCVACSSAVSRLSAVELAAISAQTPAWEIVGDNHHITRNFKFKDFVSALKFVNRIGELAEMEGHHPDIYLTWGRVRVDIWTHKVDGLTENDFILAAKIDAL